MSISKQHDFTTGTTIVASEVNTNFDDLFTEVNTNMVHKDGSVAFTGVPSGPATDPSTDNQLARKAYVDLTAGEIVNTDAYSGNGIIAVGASVGVNNWNTIPSLNMTEDLVDGEYYRIEFECPGFMAHTSADDPWPSGGVRALQIRLNLDGDMIGGGYGAQVGFEIPGISGMISTTWLQSGTAAATPFNVQGRHESGGTNHHYIHLNDSAGAYKAAKLTLWRLGP